MNIFLSVGDVNTENWIRGMLSTRATWTNLENADFAVVTRLSDAVTATKRNLALIYVAGLRDKEGNARIRQAKNAGVAEGSILSWASTGDAKASLLLAQILNRIDESIPTMSPRYGAFRIKVISTRQSGGTFFAWNFWDTLLSHGIDASLVCVSSASPLATWIDPPHPKVIFGETVGCGDVCVIDATDSLGLAAQIEADATILVTDLDPSKPLPVSLHDHGDIWRVINRVPIGVKVPEQPHLTLIDLGADVYTAMQTSTPVTQVDEVVADVIWNLYVAIANSNREVALGIDVDFDGSSIEDKSEDEVVRESEHSSQDVAPRPVQPVSDESQNTGFSIEETPNQIGGFSMDEESSGVGTGLSLDESSHETGGFSIDDHQASGDGGFSLDESQSPVQGGFVMDDTSRSNNGGGFALDTPASNTNQPRDNAGGGFVDDSNVGGFRLEG